MVLSVCFLCFLSPCTSEMSLPICRQAVRWMSNRSACQRIREREEMISRLEEAGEKMWELGTCDEWLSSADVETRNVVGEPFS